MARPTAVQAWLGGVVLLIITLIVGGGAWMAVTIDGLHEDARTARAAMDGLVQNYADLYAEAQAKGFEPDAPEPADVVGSLPVAPPQRGEPGRPPTTAEIEDAVRSYCDSRGNCRGPVGATGQPGPVGPSGPGGEKGSAGTQGPPGADGAPGATGAAGKDGAPGRPPTLEEIATAVTAYCEANGGCRGPIGEKGMTGDTGQTGAAGAPGPTCPSGYTATEAIVLTATGPTNSILCQTGAGN